MPRLFQNIKNISKKALGIQPIIYQTATLPTPNYHIQETSAINCRASELTTKRLNLLVPALSIRYAFGGINTAVDFFLQLVEADTDVRIIITDEATSDLNALRAREDWQSVLSSEADREGKLIVCFGNRVDKTLPVREGDIFVATAWWTAYTAHGVLAWQKQNWETEPSPLIYLIQDFEPGFYSWSSRYSMCLSTYFHSNTIAVFNTKLLADFFTKNDISFNSNYIFEPFLNRTLSLFYPSKDKVKKKKRIIFYGRPGVERNAFEILVSGLHLWSSQYDKSFQWEIISLGEAYNNINLANNVEIQVKGKASLQEYAGLLLTSAIGASLMISPHPSYPPLEMAAFDLGVITNKFYNKNLSDFHSSIYSLESLTPENFAHQLIELCEKFDQDNTCFRGKFHGLDFTGAERGFDFIKELRQELTMPDKRRVFAGVKENIQPKQNLVK